MNSTQKKRIEAEKNGDKDGKAYKLMNNVVYSKMMENLRNKDRCKASKQWKDYLKCTLKPSYMSHKIFDNNLVAIPKSKVSLKLNRPTYICILELNEVLMYELH